jgi:hypothetical protein
MSLFQPLIATAFSNYGMLRGSYAYRDSDSTVGGVAAGRRLNEADKVNANSESQKTKSVNDSAVNDSDKGKTKNASGDVLDISGKDKAMSELSGVYNSRANSVVEQGRTGKSEFGASSVETSDARIEVADSSPKTLEADDESGEVKANKEANLKTGEELTVEEEEQVRELEERDAEVRQHEAAHLAVAGQYAQGSAEYTFQTGPDGKKYAIGGSVSIDVSEVAGDPEATIAKMQQVAAAATAPAEPSNQDLKVAAAARNTEAKARAELAREKADNLNAASNESENAENKNTTSSRSETIAASKNNSQQNSTPDKILKSFVASAYANQSTLSSNTRNVNNRMNVFA